MSNIVNLTNRRGESIGINKLKVTSVIKKSGELVKVWSDDGSFCEVWGKYEQVVESLEVSEDEQSNLEQYKRDMMLQLVRNEALTETIRQLPEGNEFHKVIATMSDKLIGEACK